MTDIKQILIIGTYGIDIFHRITDELQNNNYAVLIATSRMTALNLIKSWRFDFIIINLEPDGSGHIAEVGLLSALEASSLQQNSICLAISLQYPHALPKTTAAEQLQIIAGWLTLPINVKNIVRFLNKMIVSSHRLTIRQLTRDQGPLALAQ